MEMIITMLTSTAVPLPHLVAGFPLQFNAYMVFLKPVLTDFYKNV